MNIFLNKKSISSDVISIFSFLLFYLFSTINALFIFIQFSTLQIIWVALIFLILFLILFKVFINDNISITISQVRNNLIISLLIVLILILFSNIIMFHWMKPGYYYSLFPLLDTELFLNWNRDSAYHSALIQSIINFGYPSIGLHDTPLRVYHVLSHYVDAILVVFADVEVFDSYGIFFYFKTIIYISSILVIVSKLSKDSIILYIIMLIISLSLLIGENGIAIGSHGLWFTSILLILSFNKIYVLIHKNSFTNSELSYIFVLVIIIGFGKVSTGFMYAIFLGFILLLKLYKNKSIYIMGVLWILFFYFLGTNISQSSQEINVNVHIINKISIYFLNPSKVLLYIYILIGIIFVQSCLLQYKKEVTICISSLITLLTLGIVIQLNPQMSPSDIYYFEYGFSSILILVVIFNLVLLNSYKFIIILIVLLVFNSLLNIPKNFINPPVNIYLDIKYKNKMNNSKRALYIFRQKLKNYMKKNKLNNKNTLLYISKEIYTNELSKFKGRGRTGLLMYAITGVPLIYGVSYMANDYGYSDYDKDSLWLSEYGFNEDNACKVNKYKNIIMIDSINNSNFQLIRCKDKKYERN